MSMNGSKPDEDQNNWCRYRNIKRALKFAKEQYFILTLTTLVGYKIR